MELTIYLDVLWLRTFFAELLVCLFVNLWMRQNCPVLRIVWVHALAAAVQIGLFVLAGYGLVTVLGGVFLRVVTLDYLFRPRTCGMFFRFFFWSLAAMLAVGGMLGAAQTHLPKSCWFSAGSVLCAGSMLISLLLEERRIQHDAQLYHVTLHCGEQCVEAVGLHDTGNRLIDPYVHAPVYILAQSVCQKLLPAQAAVRFIPFATVGAPHGMMEVFTVDVLEWNGGKQTQVVVGKADDGLFAGKDYCLILPAGWRPQTF